MKLGRKVACCMEKAIKAFYILMIAIVVFLGGLLIFRGLAAQEGDAAIRPYELMENKEGSAL